LNNVREIIQDDAFYNKLYDHVKDIKIPRKTYEKIWDYKIAFDREYNRENFGTRLWDFTTGKPKLTKYPNTIYKIIKRSCDMDSTEKEEFMEMMMKDDFYTKNSLAYDELEKMAKIEEIELKLEMTKVTIFFYYINTYDKNFLRSLIRRIYIMLMIKYEYEEQRNSYVSYTKHIGNLKIHLVSNYNPRKIYKEHYVSINEMKENIKYTGCFNTASGLTSINGNVSIITKENDMQGLLVHEIGHLVGCDGNIFNPLRATLRKELTKVNLEKLVEKLNVNVDDNHGIEKDYYREGLNNTNSSVLHSLFNAIEYITYREEEKREKEEEEYNDDEDTFWEKIDKHAARIKKDAKENNKENVYNIFKKFLIIEVVYSLLQTVRLLRWYGFKKIEDFFVRGNKKKEEKEETIYKYKQNDIQMFEYIFLRAYTLLNYNKYINKIFKNGNMFDPYKGYPHPKIYTYDKIKKTYTEIETPSKDIPDKSKKTYMIKNPPEYIYNESKKTYTEIKKTSEEMENEENIERDEHSKNRTSRQEVVIDEITSHITKGTYDNLFNRIFELHENKNISENKENILDNKICGSYVLDYFAVDLRKKVIQSDSEKKYLSKFKLIGGGNKTNYYYKYMKYKKRYLMLKSTNLP